MTEERDARKTDDSFVVIPLNQVELDDALDRACTKAMREIASWCTLNRNGERRGVEVIKILIHQELKI